MSNKAVRRLMRIEAFTENTPLSLKQAEIEGTQGIVTRLGQALLRRLSRFATWKRRPRTRRGD